jgi:predicted RND superfamily exporter protein
MYEFIRNNMKELIFMFVFIVFLLGMYILYFPSSLIEAFETATPADESDNPLVQIGKNSSTINALRERIDKINPEKILDKLDEMENNIKTNTDNINTLADSQNKMTEQTNTEDTPDDDDDEDTN